MGSADHAVLAEGLRKRCGRAAALDGFDLAVPPGTVRKPATRARPPSGTSSVAGTRTAVVLPAPLGPSGAAGPHPAVTAGAECGMSAVARPATTAGPAIGVERNLSVTPLAASIATSGAGPARVRMPIAPAASCRPGLRARILADAGGRGWITGVGR
jgi:hypothetical protein